jgi:hypothetical protein
MQKVVACLFALRTLAESVSAHEVLAAKLLDMLPTLILLLKSPFQAVRMQAALTFAELGAAPVCK